MTESSNNGGGSVEEQLTAYSKRLENASTELKALVQQLNDALRDPRYRPPLDADDSDEVESPDEESPEDDA